MPSHSAASLPSKTPVMSQIASPSSFGLSNTTQTISILKTTPPSISYAELPTPPPTPPIQGNSTFISNTPATQTSSSTVSSLTLQTLPPELLLSIISHLPPVSYGSLTQTSHTFKSFFTTHASAICNQRILTHHSVEASILCASFSTIDSLGNAWLVPTHEAIHRAQESWWDIEGSISSLHSRGTNEEVFGLQKRFHLSQPGPQFLLFLERRGWEIHTRYLMMQDQMALLESSSASETSWPGEREREKVQIEQYLCWTLERGPVRGFIEELVTFADSFAVAIPEDVVTPDEGLERVHLRERLRLKVKAIKDIFRKRNTKQESEKRALLFGEIERGDDKEMPTVSAKDVKRDKLTEELLWYHGWSGVSGYPPPSKILSREHQGEYVKEKQTFRKCMKTIKGKACRSRQRFGQVFKGGWKCGGNGSFESLN